MQWITCYWVYYIINKISKILQTCGCCKILLNMPRLAYETQRPLSLHLTLPSRTNQAQSHPLLFQSQLSMSCKFLLISHNLSIELYQIVCPLTDNPHLSLSLKVLWRNGSENFRFWYRTLGRNSTIYSISSQRQRSRGSQDELVVVSRGVGGLWVKVVFSRDGGASVLLIGHCCQSAGRLLYTLYLQYRPFFWTSLLLHMQLMNHTHSP